MRPHLPGWRRRRAGPRQPAARSHVTPRADRTEGQEPLPGSGPARGPVWWESDSGKQVFEAPPTRTRSATQCMLRATCPQLATKPRSDTPHVPTHHHSAASVPLAHVCVRASRAQANGGVQPSWDRSRVDLGIEPPDSSTPRAGPVGSSVARPLRSLLWQSQSSPSLQGPVSPSLSPSPTCSPAAWAKASPSSSIRTKAGPQQDTLLPCSLS